MNPATQPSPETRLESLQPGDLLGKYQLLCAIARGGMGQVWAARQVGILGLPRLVAIKIALPQNSSAYDAVQQFLFDEAQITASIDHPNVCKVLELGHERGLLFIAMEWIHGVPLSYLLSAILPERRLDYAMASYLVAQACSGLHAAHELRDEDGVPLDVVHRDATPQNLLISVGGDVKIVDFGIVKARNQIHQNTETGEIKGKISYLAPEQLRGKNVDRRADVFALGCVLYLATTGRRPFFGDDAGTIITRIMHGEYARPSSLVPGYPPALEAIVLRALATDPNARFQTADEMRTALEEFLSQPEQRVTRDHAAAVVQRVCGALVEQRRAEIRAAQKLFDSQNGSGRPAGQSSADPYGLREDRSELSRRLAADAHAGSHITHLSALSTSTSGLLLAERRRRTRAGWAAVGLGVAVVAGVAFAPRLFGAGGSADTSPRLVRTAQQGESEAAATTTPAEPVTEDAAGRPRPQEAPALIEVTIRAEPSGAVVAIDDSPPVATPHTLRVHPDGLSHDVRLNAPGYAETSQTVVFDRSRSLFFELAPSTTARFASSRRNPRRGSSAAARESSAQEQMDAQAPVVERAAASATASSETPRQPFSQALTSKPRRHAIDESDPFRSAP